MDYNNYKCEVCGKEFKRYYKERDNGTTWITSSACTKCGSYGTTNKDKK